MKIYKVWAIDCADEYRTDQDRRSLVRFLKKLHLMTYVKAKCTIYVGSYRGEVFKEPHSRIYTIWSVVDPVPMVRWLLENGWFAEYGPLA